MRIPSILLAVLASGTAWGGESWAPPLSAFRAPAKPAAAAAEIETDGAVLLLTNVNPSLKEEANAKLGPAVRAHKWPVVLWEPGKSVAPAMTGGDVVIAGGAGNAGKAATALIYSAMVMNSRLVIRLPRDAMFGEWRSMDKLEDPAGFYAKYLVPDWLPAEGRLPAGTTLRVEVMDHGRPHTVSYRGSGEREVQVYIDITDLKTLATAKKPTHPIPARQAAGKQMKKAAAQLLLPKEVMGLPGTPLDSREAQGLWWGKGDRSGENGWGSADYGPGGVRHAHAEGYFRNPQEDGSSGLPGNALGFFRGDYSSIDGVQRGVMDVGLTGERFGANFRFLSQKAGLDNNTLLRAGATHRARLGPLRNDLSAKVGYLNTTHSMPGGGSSDRGDGQLLWGAGDVLSLGLDLKRVAIVAEAGADAVWSHMYNETKWDNYRLHGGVQATVPLTDGLHLMGQYKHRVLEHNPEKYFFSTSKTDDQALAGLSYSRGSAGAGVLGGVQVIKGDQADDHRKKAGVWVKAFDTTLTGLASRGEWTEELTVGLARKVAKDWEVEAYFNRDSMVRYDYKQDYFGLRVAWGFGGSNGSIDERRYRSRPDDIYAQRSYEDRRLPYDTFAKQMGSVRNANEFAGKNLSYVTGDANKWARTPTETYGGRAGDCDEQAWLVSRALNDNAEFRGRGGKAYILDYWTGSSGHGVSLVEEGGKVYLNEYGRTYRIDVNPNASLDAKAKAALQQAGRYLALKPGGKDPLMYSVFRTNDNPAPPPPGGYDMTYFNNSNLASNWVFLSGLETESGPPPVETGVNALLGADSF